eukprot:6052208-Karenia_brevis.AAC.1
MHDREVYYDLCSMKAWDSSTQCYYHLHFFEMGHPGCVPLSASNSVDIQELQRHLQEARDTTVAL